MSHPDTEVLAEFHAGLITGRRGARLSGHLADCERCTALGRQLADLSAVLATVPAPAMPQSVAHRLDTVLAAEVAKNIYPERPRGDGSPEAGSRHRRPGNRGFRLMALRVLAPVAVVLLAAAGYGLSRLASGPSSQGSAASSAGSPGPGVHAEAPAVGGTGPRGAAPLPVQTAQQPRAKPQFMSPHRFIVWISNTDYRHGTLRQQLEAELGASAPSLPAQAPDGKVMACVRLVTSDANPVYVERARFEGRPATIIVVSKGTGEVAWVAGAGCSGTNPDLLDRTTLPPGI
jgi:hypothetical protein